MNQNYKSIVVDSTTYLRIPVKTRILTSQDDILEVIKKSTKGILQPDDIITISESPLAITQGRAIPISEIKIGWLAKILWRFVSKVKYGIGLRSPTSMQCAIDEVGTFRIFFAAITAGFARLLGRRGKGDFYRLAGKQAALIDAAHTSPVPPYDVCVIKGPKEPDKVAQRIKNELGNECAVMDINDIGGCWMVGGSKGIDKNFMEKVMNDNPQGQADELTPICLVRRKSIS